MFGPWSRVRLSCPATCGSIAFGPMFDATTRVGPTGENETSSVGLWFRIGNQPTLSYLEFFWTLGE